MAARCISSPPRVDDGPIIAQAAVPVLVGDNEETLAARVLKAEHQLYPLALGLVAEGKVMMKDGRTVFEGETLLSRRHHADLAGELGWPQRSARSRPHHALI